MLAMEMVATAFPAIHARSNTLIGPAPIKVVPCDLPSWSELAPLSGRLFVSGFPLLARPKDAASDAECCTANRSEGAKTGEQS